MPTLGQILKGRRQSRGLSLEEVASATKIKLSFLRALEEDNYRFLPDPLYLAGFLNEYAIFLELDPAEMEAIFRSQLHHQFRPPEMPLIGLEARPIRKKGRQVYYIGVFVLLLILVGGWLFQWIWGRSALAPPLIEEKAPATTFQETREPLPPSIEEIYVLRAEATELAWIGLLIDGKERRQALLKPGEVGEWRAKEGFLITLGNAGGIKLYLNGVLLPKFGVSGQVVRNLALPRPEEKEG